MFRAANMRVNRWITMVMLAFLCGCDSDSGTEKSDIETRLIKPSRRPELLNESTRTAFENASQFPYATSPISPMIRSLVDQYLDTGILRTEDLNSLKDELALLSPERQLATAGGFPKWLLQELEPALMPICRSMIARSNAGGESAKSTGSYSDGIELLGRIGTPEAASVLWNELQQIRISNDMPAANIQRDDSVLRYLNEAQTESLPLQAIIANGHEQTMNLLVERFLSAQGLERGVILASFGMASSSLVDFDFLCQVYAVEENSSNRREIVETLEMINGRIRYAAIQNKRFDSADVEEHMSNASLKMANNLGKTIADRTSLAIELEEIAEAAEAVLGDLKSEMEGRTPDENAVISN